MAAKTHWSKSRLELKKFLTGQSDNLAEIYSSCVELIFSIKIHGRQRLLGHAIRELSNHFIDSQTVGMEIPDGRTRELTQKLVTDWEKTGFSFDDTNPGGEDYIPVPVPIVQTAKEIVEKKRRAYSNTEKIVSMLTGGKNDPKSDYLFLERARAWNGDNSECTAASHNRKDPDSTECLDNLKDIFLRMEKRIFSLTKSHFEGIKELDQILEETNT